MVHSSLALGFDTFFDSLCFCADGVCDESPTCHVSCLVLVASDRLICPQMTHFFWGTSVEVLFDGFPWSGPNPRLQYAGACVLVAVLAFVREWATGFRQRRLLVARQCMCKPNPIPNVTNAADIQSVAISDGPASQVSQGLLNTPRVSERKRTTYASCVCVCVCACVVGVHMLTTGMFFFFFFPSPSVPVWFHMFTRVAVCLCVMVCL
jgi:hypothetical protein